MPGDFFFSITKSPPKTVIELFRKAQKYMNAKDAMLAKELKAKKKRDEGVSKNRDKKKETFKRPGRDFNPARDVAEVRQKYRTT